MPRVFCGVDPAKTVWLLPRHIAICYPCVQRLFRRVSQPANDLCDGLRCIIHCKCLFLLLPCVHNPFLSPCPGFCPQGLFKFQKNLYKTLITCATQCQDTKQIKIVVQTYTIKPSIHFFLLLNSIKNEIFTIVATMIISRDTNETIPQKRKKLN